MLSTLIPLSTSAFEAVCRDDIRANGQQCCSSYSTYTRTSSLGGGVFANSCQCRLAFEHPSLRGDKCLIRNCSDDSPTNALYTHIIQCF